VASARRRAVLPPLTGGVNYTTDVFSIASNQAQYIKNFHIDPNGQAYSRGGSRLLNTTLFDHAVTSIYDYRRPDGSSYKVTTLVTAGDELYTYNWTTGLATSIANLSGSGRPTWATFQDDNGVSFAFMANGTDFIKYNGTNVTNVVETITSIDYYPWTNCAPRYIIDYDDRLIACGCDSDPYKVFISTINDGTDFVPDKTTPLAPTPVYWTIKGQSGNRVTGCCPVYNYLAIFQYNRVNIITEADPESSTSQQITVSTEYGTTSYWSIQSLGNQLFFADNAHLYIGTLRAAVENGLEVKPIDDNITDKYGNPLNYADIVSVYDAQNQEIQWAIKDTAIGDYETVLVYNVALSEKSVENPYVWSGWFTGYTAYTLSTVERDGRKYVVRGDANGYMYIMEEDEQFKDETWVAGALVETAVAYEIRCAPVAPGGLYAVKRARAFCPTLYQRYDAAVNIEMAVDGTYFPAISVDIQNAAPYWDSGTYEDVLWTDKPIMVVPVTLDLPFHYIQFYITCDGSNAREQVAFSGGELRYQMHNPRKDY